MTEATATIKRKPRLGDVVVSLTSDRLYQVTEVYRDGCDRIYCYGVVSIDDGLTNGFAPQEVVVLAAKHIPRPTP